MAFTLPAYGLQKQKERKIVFSGNRHVWLFNQRERYRISYKVKHVEDLGGGKNSKQQICTAGVICTEFSAVCQIK